MAKEWEGAGRSVAPSCSAPPPSHYEQGNVVQTRGSRPPQGCSSASTLLWTPMISRLSLSSLADGRHERVMFDKITSRIQKLCYGLNLDFVDPVSFLFGFPVWELLFGLCPCGKRLLPGRSRGAPARPGRKARGPLNLLTEMGGIEIK